jgi:hypothetical protein
MNAEEVGFKLEIERLAEQDDRAGRPAFARETRAETRRRVAEVRR